MSSFTKALITEDLNNGKFRVVEPFTYFVGDEFSEQSITVPADFVFDAFSIPVWARWALPKVQKRGNQAAALHDWLYTNKGILPEGTWTGRRIYTRKESDLIFKEALEVLGVNAFKRNLMYRAVRWGGGKHFK